MLAQQFKSKCISYNLISTHNQTRKKPVFHSLSCYLLNDGSVKSINNKNDNINLVMALTIIYRLLLLSAYDNLWVWVYLGMFSSHYVKAISMG